MTSDPGDAPRDDQPQDAQDETFPPGDDASRDPDAFESGDPSPTANQPAEGGGEGLLQPRGARPPRPSQPLTGEILRRERTDAARRAAPIDYEPSPDQSMLRSPYVLAGTAVAGAIVLAVLVVILFGGSGGSGSGGGPPPDNGARIDPLTARPGSGVQARSITNATVRAGPSSEFAELGPLRQNQTIDVTGRNNEATWFEILFPPGSSGKGWVPGTALRVPEASISTIPVVASTPIPRPTIPIPTPTAEPPATETATPTVTGTATPVGGPDLVASAVAGSCAVGSRLVINVRNAGPVAITSRALSILVQNGQGVQRAFVNQVVSLAVGQSVDVDTTYVVQERVLAVVDPLGTLGDQNVSNNRVDCVVGPAEPTRTPTQPGVVTPPPIATSTPSPVPTP